MQASIKTKIHNRFDIHVRNIKTGVERQVAYAENIVLDQMYTRLCARSSYFGYIFFGTGTGTLSPSRTSLFTHLGYKTAVNDAQSKALPTSWWRQKIVLNPEEYVGSALTEVGIGYGTATTNLVTHAVIRDMNGNPISLIKTAVDVVSIYATVYISFSSTNTELSICQPYENPLINFLVGNTSFPTCHWVTGIGNQPPGDNIRGLGSIPYFASAAITWTADVVNKKFYSDTKRIAVGESNEHLTEIAFGNYSSIFSFKGIGRLKLPATGIYSGLELEGVSVGTGDGDTTEFHLPSKNVDLNSIVVYVDDVESTVTRESVARPGLDHIRRLPYGPYESIIGYTQLAKDRSAICSAWNVSAPDNLKLCINDGSDGYSLKAAPESSIPGGISRAFVSRNAKLVAYTYESTPFLIVFEWNESSSDWEVKGDFTGHYTSDPDEVWFSDDGNMLCIEQPGSYAVLDIWDYSEESWTKRTTLSTGVRAIVALQISPDKTRIAVCGVYTGINAFNCVFLWNGSSFVTEISYSAGSSSAYSGASKMFLNNAADFFMSIDPTYGLRTFDRVASTWTQRPNIVALQGAGILSCAFSNQDGSHIKCYSYQQGLVYDLYWNGSTWSHETSNPPPSFASEMNTYTSQQTYVDDDFTWGVTGCSEVFVVELHPYFSKVTFASPPANGAVITADYTVKGIHKTAQRVIDLYAEIVFGEVI